MTNDTPTTEHEIHTASSDEIPAPSTTSSDDVPPALLAADKPVSPALPSDARAETAQDDHAAEQSHPQEATVSMAPTSTPVENNLTDNSTLEEATSNEDITESRKAVTIPAAETPLSPETTGKDTNTNNQEETAETPSDQESINVHNEDQTEALETPSHQESTDTHSDDPAQTAATPPSDQVNASSNDKESTEANTVEQAGNDISSTGSAIGNSQSDTATALVTVSEHLPATSDSDSPRYASRSGRLPRYIRRTQQAWRSRRTSTGQRVTSLSLLALLLLASALPLIATLGYGLKAYQTYVDIRAHANNGYQHLLAVKTLFTPDKAHPSSLLDTHKLLQARQDFTIAHSEMVQVQTLLDQASFVHAVEQYLPAYRPQVATARAGSQIGADVSAIGQQLSSVALVMASRLHGPLLSDDKTPLITPADLQLVDTALATILPLVSDIQQQVPRLSLNTLPINAHQRDQIRQLLPLLPHAQQDLMLIRSLLGSVNWLLGVDQPRTFLVQTLDRAELRATGGFTGQYGELKISGGRIAPFSLHNIALVEYADNNPTLGNLAPAAYRSWWPFANWGLRDSNLSADFPTSAQLAMAQYEREIKQHVDGVISFTPFLVQHILEVTGPISIPQYNETITAQNLEDRLHYYQLDNKGIRREEIVEKVPDSPDAPDQARKLFTSRLAHVLMDHIRQAPPQELLAIGKQLLVDLKTRDLQVYMSDPQLEALLQKYGYAGQIDRSTTHDGLYIVQMNLSASKASQFVQTLVQDTVNLDSSGGALHQLQMRLVYGQRGPVYGLDTYRDYVRVYVPPTAQFRSGDGFDTGTPLCGGVLGACPANGIYPHNELVCPPGQYDAGAAAPMLNDPYAGAYHPLDTIGPPTNFKSDESGRAMFAGWVVIPKNCTMTVTLSWYVPAIANSPYSLLVQRQAGTFPQLDLAIHPTTPICPTPLSFSNALTEDTAFTLSVQPVQTSRAATCTLQAASPWHS